MLTRATGKLLPVPCSWLLSSVLLFVEVNSKSGCLGQRHRNQAGKLCWSWDRSLLCVFAVGRGEPGAEQDVPGDAEVPGRCLSRWRCCPQAGRGAGSRIPLQSPFLTLRNAPSRAPGLRETAPPLPWLFALLEPGTPTAAGQPGVRKRQKWNPCVCCRGHLIPLSSGKAESPWGPADNTRYIDVLITALCFQPEFAFFIQS